MICSSVGRRDVQIGSEVECSRWYWTKIGFVGLQRRMSFQSGEGIAHDAPWSSTRVWWKLTKNIEITILSSILASKKTNQHEILAPITLSLTLQAFGLSTQSSLF
jgi:hypothetical protein